MFGTSFEWGAPRNRCHLSRWRAFLTVAAIIAFVFLCLLLFGHKTH